MKQYANLKKVIFVFMFSMSLFLLSSFSVYAKEEVQKLNMNETYTGYDFNGDKKADTFTVETYSDDYWVSHYKVSINDKVVLSKDQSCYQVDIYRLKLKNGQVFLALVPIGDNDDIVGSAIYKFKNNKLVKVAPLDKMYGKVGYHNAIRGMNINGNKVNINYGVMSYSLGSVNFDLQFKYKNGTLKRSTTKMKFKTFPRRKKWKARREIKLYKAPASRKVTRYVRKNQKVTIDKIYVSKAYKAVYYHVKLSNGKSGWMKSSKSNMRNPLFNNVMYAG